MSTYRIIRVSDSGMTETLWNATQDEWDAFVDENETPDSAYVAGAFERQRRDGVWVRCGQFDTRPVKVGRPQESPEERKVRREAAEAAGDQARRDLVAKRDRAEVRRSYYLRTGK